MPLPIKNLNGNSFSLSALRASSSLHLQGSHTAKEAPERAKLALGVPAFPLLQRICEAQGTRAGETVSSNLWGAEG